ncbi:MAG: hypothetical protein AAF360_19055 [Pseudomonadota bacterium]
MTRTTGLIALWAIPRSRSTALFRSLMNVKDAVFVHEPFADLMDLGYAVLPDEEAGQMIARSADAMLDQLLKLSRTRRVILKETVEHDYSFRRNPRFLRAVQHILLVRRPEDVVASHLRLKPHVRCEEIGFENLHRLWRTACETPGVDPVVLDSDALIADPDAVVSNLCRRLGVPYDPSMLTWSPGDQQVWARSAVWHKDVAKSGGFRRKAVTASPRAPDLGDEALRPNWREFVDYHTPFYHDLLKARLTVEPSSAAAQATSSSPGATAGADRTPELV